MMKNYRVLGLVMLLGIGGFGSVMGQEPDPAEVKRRMEIYMRDDPAEAKKSAPAPKPRPRPAPTMNYDHEAWKSAEKCGTTACFEAYLADYPKGRYARMARARMESIIAVQRSKTPAVLTTTPTIEQAVNSSTSRRMITVVEFSVRGDLNEQAGAIVADMMMSAIANTGRFTLKDRLPLSASAKIAKTQELGSAGLLDPNTAAELGQTYKVDAVVTGGVYKLGDLITVTARLIDTKTASLLRSGQIQGKDIDSIQIKISGLVAMLTAPPESPAM